MTNYLTDFLSLNRVSSNLTADIVLSAPYTMPIRYAIPADEPAICALCTTAFFDEGLFGSCIHPYRRQYPDDVQIFWHETIRKYFATRGDLIIVTTRTEKDEEKIAGVAVWQRQGDDEGAKKAKEEWVDHGENPLRRPDDGSVL